MSSASRQRLLRSAADGQLSLGGELDQLGLTAQPQARPDDDTCQDAFAAVSTILRTRFAAGDDPWANSPYAWLKALPPVSRSRAGTALVEQWLRASGLPVRPRTNRTPMSVGADRLEVKVSTLWDSGEYRFQALRAGTHDRVALLGLSPHQAHLWVPPLADVLAHLDRDAAAGGWLTLSAARSPRWLAPHGGSPAAAVAALTAGRLTPTEDA